MSSLEIKSSDVRFREVDLSTTLRQRSTANGAVVLVSKKGRRGRYNVSNWTAFVAEYGERDASISFGHYAAYEFLQEGDYLDVVRVFNTDARYAAAIVKDSGNGVTIIQSITGGIPDPTNIDWSQYISGGEIPLFMIVPVSGPGSYANPYALGITSQNISRPGSITLSSSTAGGGLIAGTYKYSVSAISEIGETLVSDPSQITLSGTTTGSVNLTWSLVTGARGYYIYGRNASGVQYRLATVGSTINTWTDTGFGVADTDHPALTDPAFLPTPTPEFTLNVYDTSVNTSVPQETWTCTLKDRTDGNGVQQEVTSRINPFSQMIQVVSYVPQITGSVPVLVNTAQQKLAGGSSGTAPTNGQIADAWVQNFSDPEVSTVNVLINAGYTSLAVQQQMASLAEDRGDAFAVLDVPSAYQDYRRAIQFRQLELNLNTSYAGLYGSDPKINDNFNSKQLYIPMSGKAAAVIARNDRVAGPQYAPAGLNRGQIDVVDLRYHYNESERTQLAKAQINYARRFPGQGTAIFEQFTLQSKQSALSWVNVRRMVNVIKVAVKDYLMYSLHEPNDDILRRQIVSSLTDYLQFWKDARGILDFLVVSDDSNNTAEQYNLGILNVSVIITPVIAVQRIEVAMVITKKGVAFSEINLSAL